MQDTHSGSVNSQSIHKHSLAALTIGAIGVVFGDIGTSPLYAFREALHHSAPSGGIQEAAIFGVLSLALWSLILVVTVKYVIFLMRADNDGEGGVLALLALAGRGIGGRKGLVLVLGAVGAALFYGDAIITPALSVLSAVEGAKTIPGIGENISQQTIIYITLVIMVALFAIQSRGTALVSKLFGPICVVWFLAIGGLGLLHISDYPAHLWCAVAASCGFVSGEQRHGRFDRAGFRIFDGHWSRSIDGGHGPFRSLPDPLGLVPLGIPGAQPQLFRPGRICHGGA